MNTKQSTDTTNTRPNILENVHSTSRSKIHVGKEIEKKRKNLPTSYAISLTSIVSSTDDQRS